MASNPAATDSTANLFISAPFDRDSNSNAPPASWWSIYRGQTTRSTYQIKSRSDAKRARRSVPARGLSGRGRIFLRRPSGTLQWRARFTDVIWVPEENEKTERGLGGGYAYGSRRPCGRRSRSHPCRKAGRAAASGTTTTTTTAKEGEVCPVRRRLSRYGSLADQKYASYLLTRKDMEYAFSAIT